jgi:membrane-associated protease RseP (regulator of RpoE activity)
MSHLPQLLSLAVAIFIVVFSLIAHEMGHWVVLRRLNVTVLEWWLGLGPAIAKVGRFRIGMLPVGASIYPDPVTYAKLDSRQRMAVALGGPIGSMVYGLALLAAVAVGHFSPSASDGLHKLAVTNFMLALVNLVPIPPLDGWTIFDALLEKMGRPLSERGRSLSMRLGNGLVYGLGFFVLARFLV